MDSFQSSFRIVQDAPEMLAVKRNLLNAHAIAAGAFFLPVALGFLAYALAQAVDQQWVGAALGAVATLVFGVLGVAILRTGQHRGPSSVKVDRVQKQIHLGGRVLPFSELASVTCDIRVSEQGSFGTDRYQSSSMTYVYLRTRAGEVLEMGRSGGGDSAGHFAARLAEACGLASGRTGSRGQA